jgi:hypothetical protein
VHPLIVLYILLGLLALALGALCAPAVLRVEYQGGLTLRLRWLFLTLLRSPAAEKKKKKPKKEKPKKEKPEKEKKPKKEEEKKPNAFQRFYQYQGIPGFIELLRRAVHALRRFGRGVWNSFRIRELRLWMTLTGGDPQALVDRYGKTCAAVFPSLGWLSTHLRSKPGTIRAHITPDFTGLAEKEIACTAEVSVIPLVLLAALIMLALRLGIQVALKFLSGAKAPKEEPEAKGKRKEAGEQAA